MGKKEKRTINLCALFIAFEFVAVCGASLFAGIKVLQFIISLVR